MIALSGDAGPDRLRTLGRSDPCPDGPPTVSAARGDLPRITQPAGPRPEPDAQLAATWVRAALAELPDDLRDVLLLARAGASYRQVAVQLGLPEQRVRTYALHAVLALTQARLPSRAWGPAG